MEEHAELRLKTKLGASRSKDNALTAEQRVHGKGCTCNKSGCKKNYCECFKVCYMENHWSLMALACLLDSDDRVLLLKSRCLNCGSEETSCVHHEMQVPRV